MQQNPLTTPAGRKANPLREYTPPKPVPGSGWSKGHVNNILRYQANKSMEQVIDDGVKWFQDQLSLDRMSAPRVVNYSNQAVYALVESNYSPDTNNSYDLLDVMKFFSDENFRKEVLKTCTNKTIKEAYDPDHGPYNMMSDRQQMEHIMPLLRALQPLANDRSYRA